MRTAKRVREMTPGQVLLLISDDPATLDDIYAWCRLAGHEHLGVVSQGPVNRIWVRKLDRVKPKSTSIQTARTAL